MRCRDYIRLLIEGFSFHTLELKLIFRAGDAAFQRIMRHLEQMSSDKEFYELSIYGEGRFFCGHFFEHGIRIYLSRLDERDIIKLVINPRKLIDPKAHYLGIMLCDDRSFDRMEKKFAATMEKIGLPTNMNDWTLTRMDLCVNLIFDRKKLPCQIIELIRRGPVIKGFHKEDWVTYYSAKPIGENAALKKHSVKFENQSMAFVAYDKCYQMKQEDLPLPKEMRPRGILRLELQCKKDWIKKEAVKHGYTKTTEKIRFLAQNSRHHLRTYARKLLPAGEYCQNKYFSQKICLLHLERTELFCIESRWLLVQILQGPCYFHCEYTLCHSLCTERTSPHKPQLSILPHLYSWDSAKIWNQTMAWVMSFLSTIVKSSGYSRI